VVPERLVGEDLRPLVAAVLERAVELDQGVDIVRAQFFRLLPSDFRILTNIFEPSISCTLPRLSSGFFRSSTQI